MLCLSSKFQTSVFTPAYASVTSVWVTSLVTAPEVINILLDKFKVVNNPEDFVLYVVRSSGGMVQYHYIFLNLFCYNSYTQLYLFSL